MSKEQVNHPSHYRQGKHEALAVIQEWKLNFCLGNVVKYICRAGLKDPNKTLEDLKKARFYLDEEIKQLESKGDR